MNKKLEMVIGVAVWAVFWTLVWVAFFKAI